MQGVLAQDVDKGIPCNDSCPGFELHVWRRVYVVKRLLGLVSYFILFILLYFYPAQIFLSTMSLAARSPLQPPSGAENS